jgi:Putative silver efflux pump
MFEFLVRQSLIRRSLVLVLAGLLVLIGGFAVGQLPLDVLPDLNKPTVVVYAEAPGLAPEEVESLVTVRLEAVLAGLPGVVRVQSKSMPGLSRMFVEFNWGSNLVVDRQFVAERLEMVRSQLPVGVYPVIGPLSSLMGEIMLVSLSGPGLQAHPGMVRQFADYRLRRILMSIPGVTLVTVMGGHQLQYRVAPNLGTMRRLGITLTQIQNALRGFGYNTSGGIIWDHSQQYMLRLLAGSDHLADLRGLPVSQTANGPPVLLGQIAKVDKSWAIKFGDAGFDGQPAIILGIQKVPHADTLALTAAIHKTMAAVQRELPKGVQSHIVFEQARFIRNSIHNVLGVLRDAAIIVTLVLLAFLLSWRTTVISLTAIPLSILIAVLVFRYLGLSINTMTLGGIAIAIGELVDDAVVDVENILRRLRQNRALEDPEPVLRIVLRAALEVRSSVLHASLIVMLVFLPLFLLPGIEGHMFTSLGIAYVVSIGASLLVAMTVTPVLSSYLLPSEVKGGDVGLLRVLKRATSRALGWVFGHAIWLFGGIAIAVLVAVWMVPQFNLIFLPHFNEDSFVINLRLRPGVSLQASDRIANMAERLLLQSPYVAQVGGRTGRAKLDEHAEAVNATEMDVDIKPDAPSRAVVLRDLRKRLEVLPGQLGVNSPVGHLIFHLMSGVQSPIVIKLHGSDLSQLGELGEQLRERLQKVPGLVDVRAQQQTHVPEMQVRVDSAKAMAYGATPAAVRSEVGNLINGYVASQVIVNHIVKRPLVIRLHQAQRQPDALGSLLIQTRDGRLPLERLAQVIQTYGPGEITREAGHRVLFVTANSVSHDQAAVAQGIHQAIADMKLPRSVYATVEGEIPATSGAVHRMIGLGLISLVLIILVLYGRYRSVALTAIILLNIPLALIGSVIALWLSGDPMSLASLIGFITLTGIATRNGILKISHYVQLVAREGETFGPSMVIRGSLERLAPVLMTALAAALALVPLLLVGDAPGKEILHPVAVVIFGGLLSATLLDTLLTPVLFLRFGERPLHALLERARHTETF